LFLDRMYVQDEGSSYLTAKKVYHLTLLI
jgi:hypothetical protein